MFFFKRIAEMEAMIQSLQIEVATLRNLLKEKTVINLPRNSLMDHWAPTETVELKYVVTNLLEELGYGLESQKAKLSVKKKAKETVG